MQFDDRLKTVMMQPIEDGHDRTVRWRQLVDLLSRTPTHTGDALVDAALALIQSDRPHVSDAARAATARIIAGRDLDPRLVAIFAADKLAIAAPLLAATTLDNAGWDLVDANASDDVATLLKTLGRNVTPTATPTVEAAVDPDDMIFRDPQSVSTGHDEEEVAPSIGEMVARIERLRNQRDPADVEAKVAPMIEATPASSDPVPPIVVETAAQPMSDEVVATATEAAPVDAEWPVAAQPVEAASMFRWESDASGQIAWVDGAPRGPLIGRILADEEDGSRDVRRAFNDRAPFDGAMLTLAEPKVGGEWRLSGIPAFAPRDGRFLGYRGIARKEVAVAPPVSAKPSRAPRINRDLDALRETIHEIKTPLNAIIGFAEIIDGQYLGPAHRNYRLRAAEIVGQARTLMGAIDDLDFAARLQAEVGNDRQVSDVVELMEPIRRDLDQRGAIEGIALTYAIEPGVRIASGEELLARLIRRFLTATVNSGEAGEHFDIRIERAESREIRVSISRPMVTIGLGEDLLLDPSYVPSNGADPSILGLGFALRMVRGLARMIGGDIEVGDRHLAIILPEARG